LERLAQRNNAGRRTRCQDTNPESPIITFTGGKFGLESKPAPNAVEQVPKYSGAILQVPYTQRLRILSIGLDGLI
jgi:hypothetical protein